MGAAQVTSGRYCRRCVSGLVVPIASSQVQSWAPATKQNGSPPPCSSASAWATARKDGKFTRLPVWQTCVAPTRPSPTPPLSHGTAWRRRSATAGCTGRAGRGAPASRHAPARAPAAAAAPAQPATSQPASQPARQPDQATEQLRWQVGFAHHWAARWSVAKGRHLIRAQHLPRGSLRSARPPELVHVLAKVHVGGLAPQVRAAVDVRVAEVPQPQLYFAAAAAQSRYVDGRGVVGDAGVCHPHRV
eukprot:COSAG01_NODE_22608_length_848_cov_48.467290_1_plen_245_part_10